MKKQIPSITLGLAAAACALLLTNASQAAIVVTLPTATVDGSVVITQDINFTVTVTGIAQSLIFDEWVSSDSGLQSFSGIAIIPGGFLYQLNGGGTQSTPFNSFSALFDNQDNRVESLTRNDGGLLFGGVNVVLSDVFTVSAATYTLAAGSLPVGFNPQTQQTFTGNAFLTRSTGERLTLDTPVGASIPEPSTFVVGLLSGLALLRRRR